MIWGRKSELCLQCQYTNNIVQLKFCQFSSTFVRINIIMNTNLTSKTFKDNVGNCLVAIQEIQSGDVVLNDPPLIVALTSIIPPDVTRSKSLVFDCTFFSINFFAALGETSSLIDINRAASPAT